MIAKGFVVAALLAIALTPRSENAQTPAASPQPPAFSAPSGTAAQGYGGPAARPDCAGGPCDNQPPHITVANPPIQPAPWLLRDRITWAANLVLVLLGYAGIMLAVSILKKIERQTGYAETAAQAAAASAEAALLHAQSILHAERPWLLITVEPSLDAQDCFSVVATNRGRTPAQIDTTAEEVAIAVDESRLPETPHYRDEKPGAPRVPIFLLPGESTTLKTFSREEARGLCGSEERFKRIETWEEKIYLYGKVIYRDLIAPEGKQAHETAWCCWYIHGRQKSGLVVAGPRGYTLHT
jgi:hypothetical protein